MLLPLLLATASALSYPPEDYTLEDAQDSPSHTFRVETYHKGGQEFGAQLCVWTVAPDTKAAELLVPPGVLTPLYQLRICISLDERWILWEQKLYHGADAYGLFERTSGIHYREIGPPIFSEQAWRFFREQTHRTFTTDYKHIMRVSDWPTAGSHERKLALFGDAEQTTIATPNDHSLLISLTGDDHKASVTFWYCYYDLVKHQFYLDAAVRQHNRDSITASHDK